MIVLSLENILEAAVADRSTKNLSGYIHDVEQLLTKENLRKLEIAHDGIFAFLAFHPKLDTAMTDYVQKGSLSADAGSNIFAMFVLDQSANTPQRITDESFKNWLTIDEQQLPSYEIVRRLFEQNPPPLPGVAFIEKLSDQSEPVFVSFQGKGTVEEVGAFARKVFYIASQTYNKNRKDQEEFVLGFCARLTQERIEYYRTSQKTIMEWLIFAYNLAKANVGTLVSVVQLFV